ncbi:MAG: DUF1697 domain-containing protein [Rhizobiaceae bacterium]|nr:DUF1697 domain-containing protein [Rhizobiaceae bacterium]
MRTVFIILFRGVGGATQLPVKPLREKLADAGFVDVATYINSGNAVLVSDRPRTDTVDAVASICAREFGFGKDIYAVTLAEWEELVDNNPFPDAVEAPKFLHAAVLAAAPQNEAVETLRGHAGEGEKIAVVGKVAYLHTPNGFGRSKLAEKFDKGIGVANTARNWNTVLKLADLARQRAG